eukprot:CAMPEP_0181333274 /NCGR_PEP_ID=MMETSP1101-20121128/25577_1 /TAXON_ID=46948 /ORGANISM="Rhodomonas abbreviata, Strain Caron Lab Isolate" /LENGTH=58 /DNA_ID=CAMNT_0023443049 /DNA_START=46 /DNA_END=219 /DNA_ORIENTATION=-
MSGYAHDKQCLRGSGCVEANVPKDDPCINHGARSMHTSVQTFLILLFSSTTDSPSLSW